MSFPRFQGLGGIEESQGRENYQETPKGQERSAGSQFGRAQGFVSFHIVINLEAIPGYQLIYIPNFGKKKILNAEISKKIAEADRRTAVASA